MSGKRSNRMTVCFLDEESELLDRWSDSRGMTAQNAVIIAVRRYFGLPTPVDVEAPALRAAAND